MKRKVIAFVNIIIILGVSLLMMFLMKAVNEQENLELSKKSNEIQATNEYEGFQIVKFNDEKMAKAVYGALEASAFPAGYQYLSGTELPIAQTVLTETKELTLRNPKESDKITDISGIENFINLTDLKLANNLITDISPIQYLTELTSLDLSLNVNISDVSCLKNNVKLQTLNLAGNKIENLDGISQLYELKILNIETNQVTTTEIQKISGLLKLTILNANKNQIDDIEPILGLTNLKELMLYDNSITNLEGISNLRNLEKLNLGDNGLGTSQVGYIFEKVEIKYKEEENGDKIKVGEKNKNGDWVYNELYNEEEKYKTTSIAKMNNLYYLNVELNNMTDLFTNSNIQYMKNLKEIYAQSNKISRLTNIYKLEKLEVLNLNDNDIIDLSPIFKTYGNEEEGYQLYLQKLTNVSLEGNEIEFIYSIQNQGDAEVKYSFANFADLTTLNLSKNHIYNISTIAYKEFDSIQLFDQTVNLSVMKRELDDDFQEVILPNIFSYTLESGSNVYSEEEFSYVNSAKTSEDGKRTERRIVFVDTYSLDTNKETATITINGGFADGTILTIEPTTSNGLETIQFTDNILYQKVKDTIENYIANEEIDKELYGFYDKYNLINIYYTNDGLKAVKELDASDCEIENVDGIKRLVALTNLDISNNKITDISEISLLPGLVTLNINSNEIKNLSEFKYILGVSNRQNKQEKVANELACYKKITTLIGYTNDINNINGIATCKNITELNLLDNEIADISILINLINLKKLNLNDNYIDELEAIKDLTKLEDLSLGNNHEKIEDEDLTHLSNLPVLIKLDLSSNKLKDISSLNSISSLKTLKLNDNLIEEIELIKNLTGLANLDLSQNKISDLEGIERLRQITTLTLKKNKINDVSELGGLTSLVTLDLSYNRIEDISTIETLDTKYNLDQITLNDQTITIELTKEQTEGTQEIELPSLFEKALIEDNLVYTTKDFATNNCTVDAGGKTIIVSELGSKIAWVKIKDGLAVDSQVVLSEPLKGTIDYSTEEPTKDNVEATISFNRPSVIVTNNDEKTSYTFTENGQFTFEFEDEYGFTGSTTAEVNWIDREGPIANVEYSVTEITKEDVTVTITANEECKVLDGWTLSEDEKVLTKTYTDNTNEKIVIKDKLENESEEINILITNIDKTAPKIENVEEGKIYNQSVKPIIIEENIETIELIKDGEKVEGYNKDDAITENGEYKLIITDKVGNKTEVNFVLEIEGLNVELREDSIYKIKEDQEILYIENIIPETKICDVLSKIETNGTIKVYKGTEEVTEETTKIGTGMKIKITLNEEEVEYTAVVKGDLNGDSESDDIDLLRMVRYQAGLDNSLTGEYLRAANVHNADQEIDDIDLLKLARILVGLDTF